MPPKRKAEAAQPAQVVRRRRFVQEEGEGGPVAPVEYQRRQRPSELPEPKEFAKHLGYIYWDGYALDPPTEEPIYVGIDSSPTSIGIAVLATDGRYFLYEYQPTVKVSKGGAGTADRLAEVQARLRDIFQTIRLRGGPVRHVCMEQYGYASQSGNTIAEVGGQVKVALLSGLHQLGYDHRNVKYPTMVAGSQLKKYATGSGATSGPNAVKKEHVLKAVYKNWGLDLNSNDVADAYVLAEMARAIDQGTADTAYRKEVLGKLTLHTEMPDDMRKEMALDK